jgi:hypothetical protein
MPAKLVTLILLLAAPVVTAQSLDDLRWKHRVLVIYAPAGSEQKLARQLDLLRPREPDLRERDLKEIILRDNADRPEIIHRFRLRKFTVLLLGKDGGEKLRSDGVVEPDRIFRLIDSMPMRRDEMRRDSPAAD